MYEIIRWVAIAGKMLSVIAADTLAYLGGKGNGF